MTRQSPRLFNVHVSPEARQACELLPPRVARAVYGFLRTAMREDPEKHGAQLRGAAKGWLLTRRANFRITYAVDRVTHTVSILRIEPR